MREMEKLFCSLMNFTVHNSVSLASTVFQYRKLSEELSI